MALKASWLGHGQEDAVQASWTGHAVWLTTICSQILHPAGRLLCVPSVLAAVLWHFQCLQPCPLAVPSA